MAESGKVVRCNHAMAESGNAVRCSCPLVQCSCQVASIISHNNFHGLGVLGKLRQSALFLSGSVNISARASVRSASAVEGSVGGLNDGMAGSVSDPG